MMILKERMKIRMAKSTNFQTLILVIGHIRLCFHLPYRQTEGIINATGKSLPDSPSYSQICRRINKLDIINNVIGMDIDDDKKNTVIAIDSTGIKVTNRGLSG